MTNFKRPLALLMALSMCFVLAACSDGETDASGSAAPSESASSDIEVDLTQNLYGFASGLDPEDTAVTVNGTAISNEMFLYWLASDCDYFQSYYSTYYGFSPDFSSEEVAEWLISDVQTAVAYYAVLRELCEQNGVAVTDEQQAELQGIIDQIKEANGEDGYQKLMQLYGSEETFLYISDSSYLFTNLADTLMGEPTEDDLEQYVSDNGIFSVKHILLMTTTEDITDDDGNVTQTADEYNAAQKALAEDLLAQLQASDDMETLFDTLMNEYSEDSGLASYPNGYTFTQDDSLVDGFREASLALEPGQLSDVVETTYGYHIILRLPVDASTYHDDWISDGCDSAIMEALYSAEVTVSGDISSLDIASFYERYTAYSDALFADSASED